MTPGEWEKLLAERLGRRVAVVYGRARTLPVQVVDDRRTVRVRLHRLFAAAPREVGEALAAWLRAGRRARRACALLDAWLDARLAALPPRPPRRVRLRARGDHHDLRPLAASLFAAELAGDFEARPRPEVTWGRRARSRARRALQLGSYDPAARLVRVHPVLDQAFVPDWFVRYVLFHELLHAVSPDGRHHGPGFRARERAYPDYARALRWQRRHLGRLIRAARRGASSAAREMPKAVRTRPHRS
ncbi:MAG: hypothetical protein ACYTEZ_15615 [Planctomycetota bacterium]